MPLVLGTILQARQVRLELRRLLLWQLVNHHVTAALRLDEAVVLEVAEVLRNLYLRLPAESLGYRFRVENGYVARTIEVRAWDRSLGAA